MVVLLEISEEGRETTFMAFMVTVQSMVGLESDTLFVDSIVSQVHCLVLQIACLGDFILFSAEPD